ncbi:hypothetical protein EGM70_00595 [Enterobacteriaceae bacterium 89]|nr:hypothetical protein [Enterobacteriaceae bacterium 89]
MLLALLKSRARAWSGYPAATRSCVKPEFHPKYVARCSLPGFFLRIQWEVERKAVAAVGNLRLDVMEFIP